MPLNSAMFWKVRAMPALGRVTRARTLVEPLAVERECARSAGGRRR